MPHSPGLVGGCMFPVVLQSLCVRNVGQKGNLNELRVTEGLCCVHLQQLGSVHGKQRCVVEHLMLMLRALWFSFCAASCTGVMIFGHFSLVMFCRIPFVCHRNKL